MKIMAYKAQLPKFMGPSVLLAAALLIGRFSGLARETIVASMFGVSAQGDIAVMVMTLPDLMVNLLVAGGLSAVFVPLLVKLPEHEADVLTRFVTLMTLSVFGLFGLIVYLAPITTVAIFTPGLADQDYMLSGWLPLSLGLALPLAALAGVAGGYANARGRFFINGMGTFIFNATLIAVLLIGFRQPPLQVLALGVLAGTVMRCLSLSLHMPVRIFRPAAVVPRDWKRFLIDFCAGLGAVSAMLLAPVILRGAASWLESGSVSALNYAQKLVELPVGVILSAVSVVSLTAISKARAEKGAESASIMAVNHLQVALMLGCLAMVGSVGFAVPVAEIAFGYGNMGEQDVNLVARLFALGSLSIPFAALNLLGTNFLYATGRTRTVLMLTIAALLMLVPMIYIALSMESLSGLMVSFTIYQATLALAVMAWSDLPIFRQSVLSDKPLLDRNFVSFAALSVLPLIAAAILQNNFLAEQPVLALGMAGFSFLLGLAVIAYFQMRRA